MTVKIISVFLIFVSKPVEHLRKFVYLSFNPVATTSNYTILLRYEYKHFAIHKADIENNTVLYFVLSQRVHITIKNQTKWL